MDGMPYTKRDYVVCFVTINLITGTRRLTAVVRNPRCANAGVRGGALCMRSGGFSIGR